MYLRGAHNQNLNLARKRCHCWLGQSIKWATRWQSGGFIPTRDTTYVSGISKDITNLGEMTLKAELRVWKPIIQHAWVRQYVMPATIYLTSRRIKSFCWY